MTRNQWLRVKEVASAALEIPEAARLDYIAAACAGEARIEADVQSLVAAAARATNLFEAPLFSIWSLALSTHSDSGCVPRLAGGNAHAASERSDSRVVSFEDLKIGADFGGTERYAVRRRVGAGGMGVVYEVHDRVRDQIVALKTLLRASAGHIYRLKREFRALSDIAHPNLVCLYELTVEPEHCFFTMELVNGESVVAAVRPVAESPAQATVEAGAINTRRLRYLLRQILTGVAELHRHGTLHRDLKPSNILVTPEDRVVILDFGLTSSIVVDLPQAVEGLAGTPAYVAPEQHEGEPPSHASDAYALGVTLYEMVTGRLPFTGRLDRLIAPKRELDPESPSSFMPSLPRDLEEVCVGLLHRNPQRRMTVGDALAHISGENPAPISAHSGTTQKQLPFVGRERYLAALGEALTAAQEGRAGLVCIHGPSGIGKSALVRQFADQAAAVSAAIVLRGRCYEHESIPYKAVDGLVDSLSAHLRRLPAEAVEALMPDDVGALARAFPVLLRVSAVRRRARLGAQPLEPAAQRRLAFSALRTILTRIGERHALLLVIDDLHWADADSTALLEGLLQPPDPPRLLMVVCFRAEEIALKPFLRPFIETGTVPHRTAVVLDPLTAAEARQLLHAFFTGDAITDDRTDAVLTTEAAGNPFLLEQLAHDLPDQLAPAAATPTLERVLERRIRRLPAGARRFLDVLALCVRPMDPGIVHLAAGLAGDERPLLALLRSEHFVRNSGSAARIEMYHDRIREALASGLDRDEARAIHADIARILLPLGSDDPEALYGHYREAGDAEHASAQAILAGRKADTALAFDRAAAFYRSALELTPANPDAARWKVALAEALTNAGRPADAADVYLDAAASAARLQQIELQRRAAEQLLIGGHIDRGMTVIEDVLRALSLRLARGPRRAVASLLARRARIGWRGLGFEERPGDSIPAEQRLRIDACWSVTTGLAMVDNIRAADFNARHLLLALDAGEPYRIARAVALEASFRSTRGARREYARWAASAAALAESSAHPHATALVALAAGIAAVQFGEWQRATKECDRARRLLREHCAGATWEANCAEFFYLGSLLFQGHIREVAEQVPELLAAARERGNLYFETELRTRMNLVWLAADEPDEGERQANEAMQRWSHRGFHRQHYNHVLARVQTELYRGRASEAWQAITGSWSDFERTQLLRVQFLRIETSYLRARAALLMAANGRDSGRLLSTAIRDARRIASFRLPWTNALALLLRAGIAAAQERPTEAADMLNAAVLAGDEAGMHLYAAVARRRRAELEGRESDLLAADTWMATQGIKRPDRIARLLAPGFPERA